MKIGAYQFAVSSDIEKNYKIIEKAICRATTEGVRLLAFPECALTGYPPRDIDNSSAVDFDCLKNIYDKLQALSVENDMYVVVGTITKNEDNYYNAAVVFSPDMQQVTYKKKALWGWDKDNFTAGTDSGVFEVDGLKIGIRICYEVRFPEYFRELYAEHTDLNIILFYDVADKDDVERYGLIKSHIITRAVENVCHTLSVDTIRPYQTAPTALYDKSGSSLIELERNSENMLIYDLNDFELNFGDMGRKVVSDSLLFI